MSEVRVTTSEYIDFGSPQEKLNALPSLETVGNLGTGAHFCNSGTVLAPALSSRSNSLSKVPSNYVIQIKYRSTIIARVVIT